ncbi:MAG: GSCFA domain-containing protein [Bacteroidales bacterium]|jgi:hypothetical protein|nr:GSCFA domain-containing protein [Bacteroidales bacterium]
MIHWTFRTEYLPQKAEFTISHRDKIMLIGSCFAVNIGEILHLHKFQTDSNPLGIVFNPASVSQSLELLCGEKIFTENDLLYFDNQWISLSHHGDFSSPDKEQCLQNINQRLQKSRIFLQNADYLIITLGTSEIYRYKKTAQIVANCHKIPSTEFEKTMLSVEDTVACLTKAINCIQLINSQLKIIFTVSPVRYLKGSMTGNALSKARLLCAVNELITKFSHLSYFPSYEIMTDDLRDYRFYDIDKIHPSKEAVLYLWHIFECMYFDDKTLKINQLTKEITTAAQHRFKNPHSVASSQFKQQILNKIENLLTQEPYLDFEQELEYFKI